MSKGSKRRPEDKAKMDANWDKIFKSNPDAESGKWGHLKNMWSHNCMVEMHAISLSVGESCKYCGKGEE